jgi:zinc protease
MDPQRFVLSNGVQVLYYQDPELPLVGGSLYLRGGSFYEGSGSKGVMAAMGTQLRLGGTKKLSPDDLDRELEDLAAEIGSSFGGEFGSVSFGGLSSDLPQILDLFAQVLLEPRFDSTRLDVWRGQTVEGIRRRADDPDAVMGVASAQLAYGDDSGYGRVVVESDIKAISRDKLIKAHEQFVRPDGALLAVSGDVDRAELERLLEAKIGSAAWKPRGTSLDPLPPVTRVPTPEIYFLNLPFTQASVQILQLGVPRHTPDQIAISAFNKLFGEGNFNCRLMKKIRSDLGLVYGIFGGIVAGPVKGRNVIAFKTKSESTAQAITESVKELQNMQTVLVSEAELNEAKRSVENSYVFQNESPGEIVTRKAQLELLGYPPDYDKTFVEKILATTSREIQDVAIQRWKLDELLVIVIGNDQALQSIQAAQAAGDPVLGKLRIHQVGFNQKLVL